MQIKFIDRASGQVKIETPPAEGLLNFLYNNPIGKLGLLPMVKRKFISYWYGKKMDSSKSVSKIASFVKQLDIDMQESEKAITDFVSFNDFFYRKLKPGSREIQDGFVSVGDGKLLAFKDVSQVHSFFVKGREFTLKEFLASEHLAEKYAQASMFILRLAPNDYHRYHFPFDGVPSSMTKIKGSYFSVSPYALAANFTRVFCENKREFCELSTTTYGDVLIAPVGATMVGSIHQTYLDNQEVKKAAEMGYFAFGGSTVVLLVDSAKVTIDADILENTKNKMETFVKMGERIAL